MTPPKANLTDVHMALLADIRNGARVYEPMTSYKCWRVTAHGDVQVSSRIIDDLMVAGLIHPDSVIEQGIIIWRPVL